MSGQAYGQVDPTVVQSRFDRFGSGYWTPQQGQNWVRVLPPWGPDIKQFWFEGSYHWGVGPGNKRVPCLMKMKGQPCYICEMVEKMKSSGDPSQEEVATDMRAKIRVAYNLVDLSKPDQGAHVYESGMTVFEGMLAYWLNPQWGDFTNPQTGYNLCIVKTGQGRTGTNYQVQADRNQSAITNPAWLGEMKDLSDLAPLYSHQQMQMIWNGQDPGQPDGGTTAAPVPAAAPAAAPAPAAVAPVQVNPVAPGPVVQVDPAAPVAPVQVNPAAVAPGTVPVAPAPVAPLPPPVDPITAAPLPPFAPAAPVAPQRQPVEPVAAAATAPLAPARPRCFGNFIDKDQICARCPSTAQCQTQGSVSGQ